MGLVGLVGLVGLENGRRRCRSGGLDRRISGRIKIESRLVIGRDGGGRQSRGREGLRRVVEGERGGSRGVETDVGSTQGR